jgi:hypothetical protein
MEENKLLGNFNYKVVVDFKQKRYFIPRPSQFFKMQSYIPNGTKNHLLDDVMDGRKPCDVINERALIIERENKTKQRIEILRTREPRERKSVEPRKKYIQ